MPSVFTAPCCKLCVAWGNYTLETQLPTQWATVPYCPQEPTVWSSREILNMGCNCHLRGPSAMTIISMSFRSSSGAMSRGVSPTTKRHILVGPGLQQQLESDNAQMASYRCSMQWSPTLCGGSVHVSMGPQQQLYNFHTAKPRRNIHRSLRPTENYAEAICSCHYKKPASNARGLVFVSLGLQ